MNEGPVKPICKTPGLVALASRMRGCVRVLGYIGPLLLEGQCCRKRPVRTAMTLAKNQYSEASMIVRMRVVTAGSVGSGEWQVSVWSK